jgi:hypothetical protein
LHSEVQIRRRQNINATLADIKATNGCAFCGSRDGELHFHHLDPAAKDFEMSEAYRYSEAARQVELGKCVVLCRDCHEAEHQRHAGPPTLFTAVG